MPKILAPPMKPGSAALKHLDDFLAAECGEADLDITKEKGGLGVICPNLLVIRKESCVRFDTITGGHSCRPSLQPAHRQCEKEMLSFRFRSLLLQILTPAGGTDTASVKLSGGLRV